MRLLEEPAGTLSAEARRLAGCTALQQVGSAVKPSVCHCASRVANTSARSRPMTDDIPYCIGSCLPGRSNTTVSRPYCPGQGRCSPPSDLVVFLLVLEARGGATVGAVVVVMGGGVSDGGGGGWAGMAQMGG